MMMIRSLTIGHRLSPLSRQIARAQSSVAVNSKLRRDEGDWYFEEHTDAILTALNSYTKQNSAIGNSNGNTTTLVTQQQSPLAKAYDLTLTEAAEAAKQSSYDKILVLMRHGEAQHNLFQKQFLLANNKQQQHSSNNDSTAMIMYNSQSIAESNNHQDHPIDPLLTGKGCGQMLALSRTTATYFSKESGFTPDLFVTSPLKRALQSAVIAFPTHTPWNCVRNRHERSKWICHPYLMERANENKSEYVSDPMELENMFPGVDFSLYRELVEGYVNGVEGLNGVERVPLFENKIDLLGRTDEFVRWVKEREERVIVGEWL